MTRVSERWPGKLGRKYVQIPLALLRHADHLGLDDGAVRLLVAMESFRRGGEDEAVFPSQETLADLCGCSVSQIERRVAKLRKLALIEVVREERGGRRRNRYTRHGLGARLVELEESYPSRARGSDPPSYPAPTRDSGRDLPRTDAGPYPASTRAPYPASTRDEVEAVEEEAGKKTHNTARRADLPSRILSFFNEQFEGQYGIEKWLDLIAARIEENPDLDFEAHTRIVRTVREGDAWWKGAPSPRIIYGKAETFERALHASRTGNRAMPGRAIYDRNVIE